MFVVTNRKILGRRGLGQFGDSPNVKGPDEIRVFNANKVEGKWQIDLLNDELTNQQKNEIGIPVTETAYASRYVAQVVLKRVQELKKNLVFFIHGYNNDVKAMLERARIFEELYNVEVIAFSWPANGGGVKGLASYKSDKRDACASVRAVYNTFVKSRAYLDEIRKERDEQILLEAEAEYADNQERREAFIVERKQKDCPFTVNLVLHSMGNYLFKQMQKSSIYDEHHMLFDNVVLVAADTNNEGHRDWVDKIQCRKDIYITINEDDSALQASRMKTGDQQKARLGHYLHDLNSRKAFYVDFTDAPNVGRSHSYFEGEPVDDRTSAVYRFFYGVLNGKRVVRSLKYDTYSNSFKLS